MENMVESVLFKEFRSNNSSIYNGYISNVNLVAKGFRCSCVLVVLFYLLFPLLDEGDEYKLPYPGIFPWDIKNHYYLCVMIQVIMVGHSAYNNSSLDILTVKLITIGSASLDALCVSLSKIDYKDDAKTSLIKSLKFYNEILE